MCVWCVVRGVYCVCVVRGVCVFACVCSSWCVRVACACGVCV